MWTERDSWDGDPHIREAYVGSGHRRGRDYVSLCAYGEAYFSGRHKSQIFVGLDYRTETPPTEDRYVQVPEWVFRAYLARAMPAGVLADWLLENACADRPWLYAALTGEVSA